MCECRCEIQEPEFDGDDGERACAAGAMTSSTGEVRLFFIWSWHDGFLSVLETGGLLSAGDSCAVYQDGCPEGVIGHGTRQ